MAHELTKIDGLALANDGAWHGMGTVVKGAMNPFSALRIAGLEWEVEQSDAITGVFNAGEQDEYRVSTDSAKVLLRSDTKTVLGVVGPDYQPFQNQQLAELAYGLRSAADGTVEVETAGSIRGGRRVWMLLRGKTVEFGAPGDETVPYLFLANGHDGSLALTVASHNGLGSSQIRTFGTEDQSFEGQQPVDGVDRTGPDRSVDWTRVTHIVFIE